MVPKLFASGKSFKTLAAYLLHDPDRAATDQRVLWTHTLSLASDDPGLAVHEMLWTFRAADDLKRQSGTRAGGRPLENPVRHFSLNWHPSEKPSREHMIETVESFLAHMKWDRQALIVCHDDKHPHVHVMLNSVDPLTGRSIDTSYEKRRAQAWALEYERQHQLIFCEERLKSPAERTPSPTRQTWEKLRKYEREDDRAELKRIQLDYFDRHDDGVRVDREWKALKSYQRDQREDFFADGKQAYRDARMQAYLEVREVMRGEWHKFHQARAAGVDKVELAARKASLVQRQNELLHERREAACVLLRHCRDREYAALLQQQKEQRHELRERQRQGLPTYRLSDGATPLERGSAKEQARRAQALAQTHGKAVGTPEKEMIREQFRAATIAIRSASEIVSNARREEEAKQRQWRQQRVTPASGAHQPARERQDSMRTATEGTRKEKELEDRVRRAWNHLRPPPSRGRD